MGQLRPTLPPLRLHWPCTSFHLEYAAMYYSVLAITVEPHYYSHPWAENFWLLYKRWLLYRRENVWWLRN